MSTCFICRETGAKICDGHCGLCEGDDLRRPLTDAQLGIHDHLERGLPGLADRDFEE